MREHTNIDQSDDEAPVARTEEWIDAYEAQATDELYEKATRYATARAEQITRVGGHADDQYILDLVQGAFADTYIGTLAWDPTRASLEQQVMNAIKSRSRHDRERALEQRRYLSFDLHDRRREVAHTRAEVEASLAADRPEPNVFAREVADRTLEALRDLAVRARDRDVLAMLAGFDDEAFTKEEVMAATRMSAKRYRNARKRLAGYVQSLPSELKQDARARA